jgi:serine/threonine protein kinase
MLNTDQLLIERYRVIRLLAHGGMSSVYQAHDLVLDREVAVKQLQFDSLISDRTIKQIREQFQREARILAALDHPNLPRVTDHFAAEDVEYLVMDYVAGQSLHELVEGSQRGLSESQVLNWADQLLSALEYIHSHGIIHRDVKPSNIRLTPGGQVFLVDFGIVKFYDPENPRTATIMHGLGTPEYAPPEQYDDRLGHTDPRSDIYALGATLYHLLTGQAPPTATQQISDPESFRHPRKINASVSPPVERAILRAMELRRSRRFASANDMRAALRLAGRLQPGESYTRRLPAWLPSSRPLNKRQTVLIAVVTVLILGGIGSSLASSGFPRTEATLTAAPSPTRRLATATPIVSIQAVIAATATGTDTPTATPTWTPTSTNTSTSTPTFTPTSTSTGTRRPTATSTFTNTPLPTATWTPKPAPPRPTSTPVVIPSPVPTTRQPTSSPVPATHTPEPSSPTPRPTL